MKKLLTAILLLAAANAFPQQETSAAEQPVLVRGKKFAFTVTTPSAWVLDSLHAKKLNLAAWFRPQHSSADTKTFIYAYGADNDSKPDHYERFIEKDQLSYKKKYPDIESQRVTLRITGALRQACVFRMAGMGDRFKQEVVYIEAEEAVIILVFSAESKGYYDKYGSLFDDFIASLKYLGNDPDKAQEVTGESEE